ncbi:short neuropeptide F [Chelonus insularis]|uniref:short neuropeptide F n=1 Tax=Chelonus insularis TaxID=460826 RepID=UPI00158D81CA|nr:short neuropeptide F-like [Chelonus insularis]XP_034942567.1 short neuropeptide F-like [Chelonus insularis]
MKRSYIYTIVFVLLVGVAVGSENYADYGEENVGRNLENLREIYSLLLRRNSYDNNIRSPLALDTPLEHLMIRKSQRSPSLRLRFGRSDPSMPQGNPFMKAGSNVASFEDN